MAITPFSLQEETAKDREALAVKLEFELTVLVSAINTIAIVLQTAKGGTTTSMNRVEILPINLLTRLQNELLAVKMLCESGFSLQAFSIGCTIYELSWMIPYIGKDEDIAEAWFAHEGTKQFVKIDQLTMKAVQKLFGDAADWNQQYGYYRELCAIKHGNAQIQQGVGFTLEHEEVGMVQTFAAGGTSDDQEVARSSWLIGLCVHLVRQALVSFIKDWITEPTSISFAKEQVQKLDDASDQLKSKEVGNG